LEFSDAALSRKRAATNGIDDLMSCRQQALAEALKRVNRQVMATGTLVTSRYDVLKQKGSGRVLTMGSAIMGDKYLKLRVKKELARSEQKARRYQALVLLFRMVTWVAGVVGTILAIPSIDLVEYVAIAVAVTSAAQQVLWGWRLEETREANREAAAVLADVEMKWNSLPREARSRQHEIDRLVGQCERVLLAALPPKPSGASDYNDEEDDIGASFETVAPRELHRSRSVN
jgi:hypothetical protein